MERQPRFEPLLPVSTNVLQKNTATKLANGSAVTGHKTEKKEKTAKPVIKVEKEKVETRVVPPPSVPKETRPPPQEDQTIWEDADDWSENWTTPAEPEERTTPKEEERSIEALPIALPTTKPATVKKENGIGLYVL